jgi:transposase
MAELAPRIVEKGIASDRVVVETVVAKYCDHFPLYRQEAMLEYYWVIQEHFDVELFCGITPLRARPTREALRGIYRGPGKRRGARRPARAFEELLQRIAVTGGAKEH